MMPFLSKHFIAYQDTIGDLIRTLQSSTRILQVRQIQKRADGLEFVNLYVLPINIWIGPMRSRQSQEDGGVGEHCARCKEITRGSDLQGESDAA